jgi:hypothetical protein
MISESQSIAERPGLVLRIALQDLDAVDGVDQADANAGDRYGYCSHPAARKIASTTRVNHQVVHHAQQTT